MPSSQVSRKALICFRFAGGVLELAVLDVTLTRRHVPVRAELDAVGRVEVDHLDLAAEHLSLGERRHP